MWPLVTDLFPWRHTGVEMKRTWPIAPVAACLRARWDALLAADPSERDGLFRPTRDRDTRSRPPALRPGALNRAAIGGAAADEPLPSDDIAPYEFRSLDRELVILDERLGDFMKPVLWRSHGDRQVYLATLTTHPLAAGPGVTVASASPPDRHFYRGSYGGADIMPLYRDVDATRPNVTRGLLARLGDLYGSAVAPEDLLAYVVGLLGTSAYSARFAVELREPGPRVPLTASHDLFRRGADLGARLVFLETRGDRLGRPGWSLPSGAARIETPIPSDAAGCPTDATYDATTQTISIGAGEVRPVKPEVWRFEVSGYRAVQEWIMRRLARPRGKTSSALDEIRPIAWDAGLQRDLLLLLAIVEEIVTTITPQAIGLLDEVLDGALIDASELPSPGPPERKAPRLT